MLLDQAEENKLFLRQDCVQVFAIDDFHLVINEITDQGLETWSTDGPKAGPKAILSILRPRSGGCFSATVIVGFVNRSQNWTHPIGVTTTSNRTDIHIGMYALRRKSGHVG